MFECSTLFNQMVQEMIESEKSEGGGRILDFLQRQVYS